MGEKYKTDIISTDIMSERIPLLEQIVNDLAFDFGVHFRSFPAVCFCYPNPFIRVGIFFFIPSLPPAPLDDQIFIHPFHLDSPNTSNLTPRSSYWYFSLAA